MTLQRRTLTFRNAERVSASGIERRPYSVTLNNVTNTMEYTSDELRIYPALWNAHEHLEFNLYPNIGDPPYESAYTWGLDITQKKRRPVIDEVLKVPERIRYQWGALKNILSATPFVLHHGETPDYIFENDFPVSVLPGHGSPHSLRFEKNLDQRFADGDIRSIHLAEGTDDEAREELGRLHEMGYLDEHTGIVHGVGLSDDDVALLMQKHAKFIWCPSSNDFLFDHHAPTADILEAGIPVMLGTDSTLSGSDGMLSEIRFAADLLDKPEVLFDMTTGALRRWICDVPDPGNSFFVVRKQSADPMEDFLSLSRADILLLVHRELVLMADREFLPALSGPCTRFVVDGRAKTVAGEWSEVTESIKLTLGEDFLQGVTLK